MKLTIVFWQESISIHQSALLRSLSSHKDISVILVSEHDVLGYRKKSGWFQPDFGEAQLYISPNISELERQISRLDEKCVHIFSGIRVRGLLGNVLNHMKSQAADIGIYSEANNWLGIKGRIRFILGRFNSFRYRNWVMFILAVGNNGVSWFSKLGYPQNKIYPFGYFVEKPSDITSVDNELGGNYQLLFVGNDFYGKGLDLLITALSGLCEYDWSLKIIGENKDKQSFLRLINHYGIVDRVDFLGILPNSEVITEIAKSDLVVLPSRWDGWGAVVNESLMNGVPVICSDMCGAAALIQNRYLGEVFHINSIGSLREALAYRIQEGKKTAETVFKIKNWSERISGESAANYLLEVIYSAQNNNGKPCPPWLLK